MIVVTSSMVHSQRDDYNMHTWSIRVARPPRASRLLLEVQLALLFIHNGEVSLSWLQRLIVMLLFLHSLFSCSIPSTIAFFDRSA